MNNIMPVNSKIYMKWKISLNDTNYQRPPRRNNVSPKPTKKI